MLTIQVQNQNGVLTRVSETDLNEVLEQVRQVRVEHLYAIAELGDTRYYPIIDQLAVPLDFHFVRALACAAVKGRWSQTVKLLYNLADTQEDHRSALIARAAAIYLSHPDRGLTVARTVPAELQYHLIAVFLCVKTFTPEDALFLLKTLEAFSETSIAEDKQPHCLADLINSLARAVLSGVSPPLENLLPTLRAVAKLPAFKQMDRTAKSEYRVLLKNLPS